MDIWGCIHLYLSTRTKVKIAFMLTISKADVKVARLGSPEVLPDMVGVRGSLQQAEGVEFGEDHAIRRDLLDK